MRDTQRGRHIGSGRSRLLVRSLMRDSIPGPRDHVLRWKKMLNHWAPRHPLIWLSKSDSVTAEKQLLVIYSFKVNVVAPGNANAHIAVKLLGVGEWAHMVPAPGSLELAHRGPPLVTSKELSPPDITGWPYNPSPQSCHLLGSMGLYS